MRDNHDCQLRQRKHALGHRRRRRQEYQRRRGRDTDRGKRGEVTRQVPQPVKIDVAQQRDTEHRRDGHALEQPDIAGKVRAQVKDQ